MLANLATNLELIISLPNKDAELLDPLGSEQSGTDWRFVTYNLPNDRWVSVAGSAAPHFWVNPNKSNILFCDNNKIIVCNIYTKELLHYKLDLPYFTITQGSWSPDGQRFAASIPQFGGPDRLIYKSFVLEILNDRLINLGFGPNDSIRHWSPDGQLLLVLTRIPDSHKRQICLVSPDGTYRRSVSTEASISQAKFLSNDTIASIRESRGNSERLFLDREKGSIWITSLSTNSHDDKLMIADDQLCYQDIRWNEQHSLLAFKAYFRMKESIVTDLHSSFGVFSYFDTKLMLLNHPQFIALHRRSNMDFL